jgi:hypothetical protein
VAASVPKIEVADHADALRVRREHHKGHSRNTVELAGVCAKFVVEPEVIALAQQVQIEIRQDRRKAIRIVHLNNRVTKPRPQPIARGSLRTRPRKQSGDVDPIERR